MGSTGAVRRRREPEQDQPPDGAAVEAGLRRVIAGSEAVQRRLGRHERAITAEVGRMRQVAADCPNAERLAMAADKLAARVALVAVELISDAAHNAEAREACELYAQTAAFTETMRQAAFEAGRQAGIAEEQARQSRAPRARHAARKRHLRVAGGIAAGSAVAASLVAGSAVVATTDSALVHAYAASRPVVHVRAARPDTAVLVPQARPSYVPRHARKPSADAATASPVPSSVPSSAPAPQPPATSPVASPVVFDGTLDVQTAQAFIGSRDGARVIFEAVGGTVSWSASAPAGVTLSESSGVLGAGESGVITVTVEPGMAAGSGVVTITDGRGNATQVAVSWVAVPGLPL